MKGLKEIKCLLMIMKTAKCLYYVRRLMLVSFFALCVCFGIKAAAGGKLKKWLK